MGLVEDFERQYSILTAEITTHIGRLSTAAIGKQRLRSLTLSKVIHFLDDRRNLIVEINRGIDEAQEVLEQIQIETNQNPDTSQRNSQQMRLKSYYAELKRLEGEYNKSKIKPNTLANSLDDSSLDDFDVGEDQKRRLLDNSERLERSGHELEGAYRTVIETEEIGTQILMNLSSQRESIQRSRNRLRETNADLGRSNRLMNVMILRSIRDKFVLYLIGVVFVLAAALAIYFSLK